VTTYEHGKQPDGAPVTYTLDQLGFVRRVIVDGENDAVLTEAMEHPMVADRICRAFHLAKLAEEAASTVESFGTDAGGFRTDWLRRYREAVR